ncbi:NUDIX domain-containing protein [Dyadobacter sp. CY323]|uniref:NUDIX domain-containing protein n=1 Tax=Dyadobacter sp. CY323 TaxID=2907302 RepID=UPI001F3438EF|nr:NUDIX domain-containing protein [Dyadobacter sp. CY323]MCE6990144.1 NUDIX domain-containing protein [Dyadobacter sp. CY323]
MASQSAGILMYRKKEELEVLLVHPGGPFFARKDLGSWSIPKGIYVSGEDALDAAKREFEEETGFKPEGDFIALKPVKLKSGKEVKAWACEGDLDASAIVSNSFDIEWPPRSGKRQTFPEVDKAGWFGLQVATQKMNERQIPFLEELKSLLKL